MQHPVSKDLDTLLDFLSEDLRADGVKKWNHWRQHTNKNLRVHLSHSNFSGFRLMGIDFRYADLRGCNFTKADLYNANFDGAELDLADFTFANLTKAKLSTSLSNVTFIESVFKETDFSGARMSHTTFSGIDLSEAKGLESVSHWRRSYLSIDTLFLSKGKIPVDFLRGCGVPEDFITYMDSLILALKPIQFFSCFISHSSKDQDFAEQLHGDLQDRGV